MSWLLLGRPTSVQPTHPDAAVFRRSGLRLESHAARFVTDSFGAGDRRPVQSHGRKADGRYKSRSWT